eukprot:CAMPEP_0206149700 /NCGR_PEP_ID=MMETSP1473-20131121/37920_1 /ASSEMBLY_ACC=CAM_ASM_001109 /TAXON_ID=1461547 /ORGANISM="Stichococcus sp, Strain RCC1054" /LENGTH=251 /DNA_ID=CAMNT_0053547181 /DNA_START=428 /DNA_END=1184 /DNA_ORIENTATION=+
MTKICLFGSLAESARAHEQTLSHFWPPTYAADGTCNCKSCPLYSASDSIKEGLKLCSLGRIFLPDPDDALIEHMLDACHRLSHLRDAHRVQHALARRLGAHLLRLQHIAFFQHDIPQLVKVIPALLAQLTAIHPLPADGASPFLPTSWSKNSSSPRAAGDDVNVLQPPLAPLHRGLRPPQAPPTAISPAAGLAHSPREVVAKGAETAAANGETPAGDGISQQATARRDTAWLTAGRRALTNDCMCGRLGQV